MQFLHLCATNDRNGNPRRLFVLVDEDGNQVACWDEGYMGSDAVPGPFRRAAYDASRVDIKPGEYNRLRRTLPSPDWAHEVPGYAHLSA